jgi:hypothetical protein
LNEELKSSRRDAAPVLEPSRFVAVEELVFFAACAIGAFEAADEENCYTQRNQDG